MADIFSTNYMMGVLESLVRPSNFLLSRFFPFEMTDPSEEIHFDVIDKTRRLAPFVSPVVAGRVVEARGHTAKTFKPAYIKPKTPWNANAPLKRAPGERVGGSLSPLQRLELLVARTVIDHSEMIDRRMEVMAAEAMRTGKITVSGQDYPTVVVDFGRAAGHTVVLTGGNRWGQSGIKPLANLQDWALTVLKTSGAKPTEVVMDVEAWKVFSDDAAVQKLLDRFRGKDALRPLISPVEGGSYVGSVGDFDIWIYAGWYLDDNSVEQPVLPTGTVMLGGADIEGVRAFGAIQDEAAGYQAVPKYAKSWVDQDPPVRYIMTQSAPLPVPTRVNATFCATVL